MRVAVCQIAVSADPAVNADRVRAALADAAGQQAGLAVFPEGTQARFGSDLRAVAEPPDGGSRVHNTTVAFDGTGRLVASYRKIHVFDAFGQRESDLVAAGGEPVVADLAGLRVGFLTCYDVRFPEHARALAVRGAELIVLPSAWAAGLFKEEHWVTLVRARAIENTVWVAAAGQVPDRDEPPSRAPAGVGRSMLVDPMGAVRADLGLWPQVGVAELDSAMTARVRAVLPCLEHRRDDVFGPADPATVDGPAGVD